MLTKDFYLSRSMNKSYLIRLFKQVLYINYQCTNVNRYELPKIKELKNLCVHKTNPKINENEKLA